MSAFSTRGHQEPPKPEFFDCLAMFRRSFAWPAILVAVVCFWTVGGPAVADSPIRPSEASNELLGDGEFSPLHEPAMRLAQGGGGTRGRRKKFGRGKRGMDGDGVAASPRGYGLSPEVVNAFMARRATTKAMEARGFFRVGLRPVYPKGLDCRTADSFFADDTRGNGTPRTDRFYRGRHGGLDIPAKGIDIVAIADGEVVEKSEGENIGGIRVVLRHSPEDTGLGVWIFSEYKHMKEPSPLDLHSRVRMVGVAWNTGTTGGGAYGPQGHYHLHLTTWYNATGEYRVTAKMLIPRDGFWSDPLAVMRGMPIESSAARGLPDDAKKVRFAYKSTDGVVHPERTKVIWPFVCR